MKFENKWYRLDQIRRIRVRDNSIVKSRGSLVRKNIVLAYKKDP